MPGLDPGIPAGPRGGRPSPRHRGEGRVEPGHDGTWWVRLAGAVFFLLLILAVPAFANPYADERLAVWSWSFAGGDRVGLLGAVESDLVSATPHPLAADIWVRVQASLGRDPLALAAQAPPSLKAALGPAPLVHALWEAGQYDRLVAEVPPPAAAAAGNPWLFRTLAAAADALDRFDVALEYRLGAVAAAADSFDGLWLLQYHFAAVPAKAHRDRIAAIADADGPLARGQAGRLLALVLGAGSLDDADRLALARSWLDVHPRDARAWRFAGLQLVELERWEEAATAFAQADALYPFAADGVDHARALIRLGRMDEARRVVEQAAGRIAPPDETGRLKALLLMARALNDAGELGRARLVLEAALAQSPQHPELLFELGRLELAAGRPVNAIGPLQRAVAMAPGHREARQRLVEAWTQAGRPVRGWEAFKDLKKSGLVMDAAWASAGIAALQSIGDHQGAETLAEEFLRQAPQSHWIMRDLAVSKAALGAKGPAAQLLLRSFDLRPPYEWSMDRFLDFAAVNHSGAEVDAMLADVRQRLPWVPVIWQRSAQRLAEATAAQRLALADAAIAAAPVLAWSHADKAWLQVALDDVGGARRTLEAGFAAVPEGLAGQRALLHYHRAHLPGTAPNAALADLDAFRRLGGHLGADHRARRRILAAAGRPDEAAAEARAWAEVRPDDLDAVAALFAPEVLARLGPARVFAFLHDVVERNPHDLARRLLAVEMHNGPGGSPLLALGHARAFDRADPDDPQVARGRARRADTVAARGRLGRLDDLDLAKVRLSLERADGVRVAARWHPSSGRLVRYAEGPAWTEARWDEAGARLLSLADAAGNAIDLTWEGPRLVGLATTGAVRLSAQVDADGMPVAIDSALPQSAATAAYNQAIAILTAWTEGKLAAVPELPGHESALDRLLAGEAKGGTAARLATAAHLVGHLAERRSHAAAARDRLEPLRTLPEAAALIQRLERETRSGGDRRLARSWLGNPANWLLWPAAEVMAADGAHPLTVLARGNGDVVVGTETGLSVLRKGRWQRYVFAPAESRFLAEEVGDAIRAGPEVVRLAEDSTAALWLAVGDGVVRLPGPYDGVAHFWPLPGITALAAYGPGVLAASPAGLSRFGRGGPQALPESLHGLAGQSLTALATVVDSEPVVLAGGEFGLAAVKDGFARMVSGLRPQAVAWLPGRARLYALTEGRVVSLAWDGRGAPGPASTVAAGDLAAIGRPHGLAAVADDDGSPVLAVLGERGLAFVRDGEAETHLLDAPALALSARGHGAWTAVPHGVLAVERGTVVR
ncbi:MAG: tetratricopeptide repeat protein [Magnetospirillum sp.]|nr:tetratricopeptide repeat protein [Magnetospirillum sp.]